MKGKFFRFFKGIRYIRFDDFHAYCLFNAFIVVLLCVFGGFGLLSGILTGFTVYYFLKASRFLFRLLRKVCGLIPLNTYEP